MSSVPSKKSVLRAILPSGLISVCVHATILIVAGMSLRGCDQGVAVPPGGQPFREVGLAVINDGATEETNTPLADSQSDAETVQPSDVETETTETAEPVVPTDVPADVPSVAELLGQQPFESQVTAPAAMSDLPQTIGPGTPIGIPSASSGGLPPRESAIGKSGYGASGSPTPGPGETSFMDIVGDGQRFVYVIDASSSMNNDQRMDLAKSQLKGSLRLLQPNQQFQVLFYNESSTRIKLRRRAAQDMYVATKVNIQLAEDEIDRVVARSGTKHKTPLLNALLLEPDVVYFLTDGDKPSLSPSELRMVKKTNRSRARIHVVEFATGLPETRDSWLEQLALQSGGVYRRINLRR
ncbi:MAG: hypothetical protein NXI04_02755 [Planctomycetaceae bacterium]|nr:hypothetical protein [Planctomycetaceae bacterium]